MSFYFCPAPIAAARSVGGDRCGARVPSHTDVKILIVFRTFRFRQSLSATEDTEISGESLTTPRIGATGTVRGAGSSGLQYAACYHFIFQFRLRLTDSK